MISVRKFVGFLMVLAIAVFALPAAAQKVYTLNMSTLSMPGGLGQSVAATFNNISPDQGNSTVKSIKLFAPSGVTIKAPVTSLAVPVNIGNGYTAYIQNNGDSIFLSSINIPLKPFAAQPVVLSMTVDVACSGGGDWTTKATPTGVYQVWNGSTFTGQTFAQQNAAQNMGITADGCSRVLYDGNGGVGSVPVDNTLYPSGAQVTVLGNTGSPPLTKPFNYFTGWTLNSTSGASYAVGSQYMMGTTGATFYAKWAPKKLTITSSPTSASIKEPFDVVVANDPGGAAVTVDATACPGATWTSTTTGSPVTSTKFTVTVPSIPASGVCGLMFNATDYVSVPMSSIKVYMGVLDCGDYDSINGPGDPNYNPDAPSTITGMGSAYVGDPGWGLRRGPNRDGTSCVKVNYTCDLTANATTNLATCTFDKGPPDATHPNGQLATFKYLFLWASRDNVDGWTNFRPQVSWGVADPDTTTLRAYLTPDWVPLLSCLDGDFPLTGLPTTILPTIPSVLPFSDNVAPNGKNTRAQYQPGVTALVCGAQQGWTSVGNGKLQIWNIIIDEADLKVVGP